MSFTSGELTNLSFKEPGRKNIEGTELFIEAKTHCTVRVKTENNQITWMAVTAQDVVNVELIVNQEIHSPEVRLTTIWDDSSKTTKLQARLVKGSKNNSLSFEVKDGPMIDDKTFLTECLNLDYPGLSKVKSYVKAGDYNSAKTEYINYIKKRKNPKWFVTQSDFKKTAQRNGYNSEIADRVVNNHLKTCDVSYQFGGTINWSINPTNPYYAEWTWQLNRHDFWKDLSEAYRTTGDEKYAQAFVRQLNSWIVSNPVSSSNIYGEYSRWRPLDAGVRMKKNWPDAFYHFLHSKSFNEEFIFQMVKSFWEHGNFLMRNHSGNGNWLTTEMNGLYTVSVLFPEFLEASKWEKFSIETLHKEQISQFYPDGAQKELAPGYHGVALEDMVAAYKLAKINKKMITIDYVSNLERAFDYYIKIRMPNGTCPALNDTGWGIDADTYLRDAIEYFPKRKDFQYFVSKGKRGREPDYTSVWMPWAGWYVMRSSWDEQALFSLFEVGPYSLGHSHEDKLSFILYGYGRPLLTEGGMYPYDTSEWRKYYVSARSHNVVRVDGKDQNRETLISQDNIRAISKPLENRWITNDLYDFGEGWYDEGFGAESDSSVKQYRALLFLKNLGWLMFDVFTPSDNQLHTYESVFHFNSDSAIIDNQTLAVASTEPQSANLQIIPLYKDGLSVRIVKGQTTPEIQGWIPSGHYSNKPVATPIYTRTSTGQTVNAYFMQPEQIGDEHVIPDIEFESGNKIRIKWPDDKEMNIVYGINDGPLNKLVVSITTNKKNITMDIL